MRLRTHEESESTPTRSLPAERTEKEEETVERRASPPVARPSFGRFARVCFALFTLAGLTVGLAPALTGVPLSEWLRDVDLRKSYSPANLSYSLATAALRVGDLRRAVSLAANLPTGSMERKELTFSIFQAAMDRRAFDVALSASALDETAGAAQIGVTLPFGSEWGPFYVFGDLRTRLAKTLLAERDLDGARRFALEQKNPDLEDTVLVFAAEGRASEVAAVYKTLPPARQKKVAGALALAYVRGKTIPQAAAALEGERALALALPPSPNRESLLAEMALRLATRPGGFSEALALAETLSPEVMPSALQRIAALPNVTLSEKERLLATLRARAPGDALAARVHDAIVQGIYFQVTEPTARKFWRERLLDPALGRTLERR